ncbi:alpha/beta hydrolase [Paeniglutamicibacter sp. MACA_103]|uniref:alpha/beta hydrolase n=1 Tax=Paeniglutamicibacter sp. MACA_103 TaxID=3377337 RepID=UPI0038946B90
MSLLDPYSCRPIAGDAAEALKAFRANGAASFHTLGVEQARTQYEAACAANGVPRENLARVEDFRVADRFDVRLYVPADAMDGRVILFLHGGGWVFGSLDSHDGLCRRLAARSGAAVVAVDYRLAPEHAYPAAIDDAHSALAWLINVESPHGLRADSIVVAGDSAGGNLAAVLTNEVVTHMPEVPLVGQVLLYPVTDLTMSRESHRRITHGFPLVADTMEWFIEQYVANDVDVARADISPLLNTIPDGMPPTIIVTVGHDPLADEGIDYAAALSRHGVQVMHLHEARYAHGLFTSAGELQRGQVILDTIAAELDTGVFPAA